MKITKNNYEAFFIDYYEGVLPLNEQEELILFLEHHPDLKVEFLRYKEMHSITVKPVNSIIFEGKEMIRKKTFLFTIIKLI